jgi:hypothetical protein
MLEHLTEIGFRKVGEWSLVPQGLIVDIAEEAESSNILYAFVLDGEPVYVGKTVQQLKKRMLGYQNPGHTQSTNIRNNNNLKNALAAGGRVGLYALPDHGLLHFGKFHLNLAAGLEDSIVKKLSPKWNVAGKLPMTRRHNRRPTDN